MRQTARALCWASDTLAQVEERASPPYFNVFICRLVPSQRLPLIKTTSPTLGGRRNIMMSAHQSLLSYRRPSNVPPQSMEAIIYDWLFGAGDEKETAFAQSPPPPHKQPQFGRARKMPISTPSPPAPPISPLSASFSTSSFMPGLCDAPLSPTLHSLPRSYATLERRSVPLATFGGEGTRDGLLSRPWGICCDSHGRILVADRSNNRVQASLRPHLH